MQRCLLGFARGRVKGAQGLLCKQAEGLHSSSLVAVVARRWVHQPAGLVSGALLPGCLLA